MFSLLGLNNNDFGILLEIIGFLFAFGTFRVFFYMFYELIRREIVYRKVWNNYKKTNEYKEKYSEAKSFKEAIQINKDFAKDFQKEYHEKHWKELAKMGEERWPAFKNILKFIGWFLVTIGLIHQFSIFQ